MKKRKKDMKKEQLKRLYASDAYKNLGLKIGGKISINDNGVSYNAKIVDMILSEDEEYVTMIVRYNNGKERRLRRV